jgi:transcriptional regulator with PAS, ATPase and Fis domain
MPSHEDTIAGLRRHVEALTLRVEEYKRLEKRFKASFDELREKEEFNFALFQYSPITTMVVDRSGRVIKSNKAKQTSGDRLPKIGDIMYHDYANRHSINMYARLMECISTGEVRTFPELAYENKVLSVTVAPFAKGAIITSQDITERVQAERDRMALIADLRKALDEVETLRGLLPICASCKKIRDDRGYWNTVEDYFSNRSKVDFSHTLCPDCIRTMYPDLWERMPKHAVKHKK